MTTKSLPQTPTGPAAAALVASGIGSLFVGLMTTGAELSAGLKTFLTWSAPVGPLSGKVGVAVIVWLISWFVLHSMWKDKEQELGKMFNITLALLALGLLFTFPPVFQAFE